MALTCGRNMQLMVLLIGPILIAELLKTALDVRILESTRACGMQLNSPGMITNSTQEWNTEISSV